MCPDQSEEHSNPYGWNVPLFLNKTWRQAKMIRNRWKTEKEDCVLDDWYVVYYGGGGHHVSIKESERFSKQIWEGQCHDKSFQSCHTDCATIYQMSKATDWMQSKYTTALIWNTQHTLSVAGQGKIWVLWSCNVGVNLFPGITTILSSGKNVKIWYHNHPDVKMMQCNEIRSRNVVLCKTDTYHNNIWWAI